MMGRVRDDGWRISDLMWERIVPLLPARRAHPLGCHRPRVPDRSAIDAIFFVLRTGCQWNALDATGICHSSSAYRRFREWSRAGVFEALWRDGLLAYDETRGIAWDASALDGAIVKSPLAERSRVARIPLTERSRARNGAYWWTDEASPRQS